MSNQNLENSGDRVRENTSETVNEQIDREIANRVRYYAGCDAAEISGRIEELEREWDMERVLETNASILAFSGVALSALHSKKWLVVPGVITAFLLQHAVQGWCPPVPVFRRLGVRTREEIERGKYALKVLRGDFSQISNDTEDKFQFAEEALTAVRR